MGEPLFIRQNNSVEDDEEMEEEDVWDDSLLIQAYNKAVDMAKEKIAKKLSLENGLDEQKDGVSVTQASPEKMKTATPAKKGGPKKRSQWAEGMSCRAVYSEDGKEYEATIKEVNLSQGLCDVVYVGYKNEETVELASLKPSLGANARKAQEVQSRKMTSENTNNTSQEFIGNPYPFNGEESGFIPPPPPPNVMAHFPKDESDALSAMLMAWYMSGYHTGRGKYRASEFMKDLLNHEVDKLNLEYRNDVTTKVLFVQKHQETHMGTLPTQD